MGTPAAAADTATREVIDAFFAAASRGDLAGLLAVLAPDVELRTQGVDETLVVRGASRVAAGATTASRPRGGTLTQPLLVDGRPAVLLIVDGHPVTIMAFTVIDGAISEIRMLTDHHALAEAIPAWVTRP